MDGSSRVEEVATPPPRHIQQPPSPTDELSLDFERLMAEAADAASDYGIRWRAPEGRLVAALIAGMHSLNGVALRAERSFASAASNARVVAEAELNKVREVALAVEGAKHQARATIEASRVEQEAALRQIVSECLPNLTDELRKTVVIREQSWNRDRARTNIRVAGLWVLGVFLAGFSLSLWLQWTDSSIGYRCKTNLVSVEGRTYCQLSGPPLQTSAQGKP